MTKTVVLIDDDELFLESMNRELGDRVDVKGFQTADAALAFLKEPGQDVDMVCVDLQMPDMHGVFWQLGGLNIIQAIRQELGDEAPFLCALTGMDAVVHIHTCLKNGADDFLEKGHDLRDVAQRLMNSAPLATAS